MESGRGTYGRFITRRIADHNLLVQTASGSRLRCGCIAEGMVENLGLAPRCIGLIQVLVPK
jgi:hypothetical protein